MNATNATNATQPKTLDLPPIVLPEGELKCACGLKYTVPEALKLKFLGVQKGEDGWPDLVLVNCTCGSTLGFEVEVSK